MKHHTLQTVFVQLLAHYTDDARRGIVLWSELEAHYSTLSRHYHTLDHLENLLTQLQPLKEQVADWEVLLFTLFYHDVVYNVPGSDNEEQSAAFAENRMQLIGVPQPKIDACRRQIIATKAHLEDNDADTALFLDADLSVLGAAPETYRSYAQHVRKEYGIYGDEVYAEGRKQVLLHFLHQERIFKTAHFYERLETAARRNLQEELGTLEAMITP